MPVRSASLNMPQRRETIALYWLDWLLANRLNWIGNLLIHKTTLSLLQKPELSCEWYWLHHGVSFSLSLSYLLYKRCSPNRSLLPLVISVSCSPGSFSTLDFSITWQMLWLSPALLPVQCCSFNINPHRERTSDKQYRVEKSEVFGVL